MEKSIKCLKEEVSKLRGYAVIIDGEDGEWEPVTTVSVEDIYELINQLDKLELLSQEFINEKAVEIYADTADAEVHVVFRMRDLQNLLVPTLSEMETVEITEEQVMEWLDNNDFYDHVTAETVLANAVDKGELGYYGTKYAVVKNPVIPQFVADWYENHKHNLEKQLQGIAFNLDKYGEMPEVSGIDKWINETERPVQTLASLEFGYEVEEEQKYYVMNNDQRMMLVRMMDGKTITEADPFKLEDMYEGEKKSHRLTEQEIKDYDPRYWAFRKPVEELEE